MLEGVSPGPAECIAAAGACREGCPSFRWRVMRAFAAPKMAIPSPSQGFVQGIVGTAAGRLIFSRRVVALDTLPLGSRRMVRGVAPKRQKK